VKRAAAFAATAAGVDYFHPLARGWSLYAGGDVYGRAYRDQSDFNAKGFDARVGGALNDGPRQWRVGATAGRFYQDGQAPGDPQPTNDRRFAGLNGEWRLAVDQKNQVGLGAQVSRQRFPANGVEDFDEVLLSASWLRSFDARGLPTLYITGFLAEDDAVRKLPDGVSDKSKRVGGMRAHMQVTLIPALQLFGGIGYTARNDRSAYARSTQVEFGRDRLFDSSLGVSWRLLPRCTLRAQWLYSRNASNIALYDYSRNEVSSALRWEFE
jgi:outer membrane protein